ncbi:MAG: M23 family metallopeptidase [Bacilli bacterium]|nr:M23 family metallopeptidase [Bacilli bacterium]
MNTKNIIITIIITLMAGCLVIISNTSKKISEEANIYYQVYLNGNRIGVIANQDKLYNLIDSNQSVIKNKYNVNNVYPPTDLRIVATNSYLASLDDVEQVYNKIEENDDFTIKGYVVTIKGEDKTFKINVLNKEVFEEAAKRFVRAFLDEDEYEKYINNIKEEIVGTGRQVTYMEFAEEITIKEEYISVNERIFTDELELSQFLLFGENPNSKSYKVKLGDTIESVADKNKLNVEEFLIANTNYKSSDTMLRVGDKVNVTLINPQITFVYDLYEISDEVVLFMKETKKDNTKYVGTSVITTRGQNGINRVTEKYSVTNGTRSQGAEQLEVQEIRPVVNQITTVGTKVQNINISTNPITNPVTVTGDWGWPTNKGYIITSGYSWRGGSHHNAIDISGTGMGSPIYAVADGIVTTAYSGCPDRGRGYGDTCGGTFGNSVVIQHANGYYTRYAHLTHKVKVKVGDTVKKGDVIGYMGSSGSSTGTHLHFATAKGSPTSYFNPMNLYR